MQPSEIEARGHSEPILTRRKITFIYARGFPCELASLDIMGVGMGVGQGVLVYL